jgi:hypothetical protein
VDLTKDLCAVPSGRCARWLSSGIGAPLIAGQMLLMGCFAAHFF